MKNLALIGLLIYTVTCFGQDTYLSERKVYDAKEITFYGYDFSHFKLADANYLTDGGGVKKYIGSWIAFYTEHSNKKDLQSRFHKENFVFEFGYTTKIIQNLVEDNLVSITKNTLPPDSIQNIINKYEINENEGIGFVVIIECFNKSNKTASAYFTFFDIATKKILMSDLYGVDKADGYGMSNYWGVGLNSTFAHYSGRIYRERYKEIYGKKIK